MTSGTDFVFLRKRNIMRTLATLFTLFILVSCQKTTIEKETKFKTIMLRAQGQVETTPDMASFRVRLKCLKNSVSASKKCLVDKSNMLNSELLGFGIKQVDILTTAVEMDKRYRWKNRSQIFMGYESVTSMIVTIKSMDSLANVYSALLENKNIYLDRLTYTHSKLDSLKNKAHLVALRNADILAEELMKELPETEKELLKIGNVAIEASLPTTKNQSREGAYMIAEAEYSMKVIKDNIPINYGIVKVDATLFVEYQIQ